MGDRLIQALAVLVAVLCLFGSSLMSLRLAESVGRHRLEYAVDASTADPPEVALGIAMGAFRGLFVNMLWLRANELKEAGKYWEAVDLAQTITKLQPRFPMVWTFHAWNMAYNISVATKTPDERWFWVKSGIDLLRKGGIVNNPNSLLIHKELGWIFLHKLGGYMDEAAFDYRVRMAIEWTEVLGQPPRLTFSESRDDAIKAYVDWLTPIAKAPRTIAELRRADPAVASLLDRVANETALQPNVQLLREIHFHRTLARSTTRAGRLEQMTLTRRRLHRLITDESLAPTWDALLPALRHVVLREEYSMEIERMIRYTRELGPIDWRNAAAHSIYWITRGTENALLQAEDHNRKDYDFLNTDRTSIHAVQELARSGDLFFDYAGAALNPDVRPLYIAAINPMFFESYEAKVAEIQQRTVNVSEDKTKRAWTFYEAGYENFVIDCIRFYYRRGQVARASELKSKLGSWEQQNINDPDRPKRFAKPIDQFVIDELKDRLTGPQVISAEVIGALQSAFVAGLLNDDPDIYISQNDYAKTVHRMFLDEMGRVSEISSTGWRTEVYLPRDFALVEGPIFLTTMLSLDVELMESLYRNAPEHLRRWAYDPLVENVKPVYDAGEQGGGKAFALAFPEPPEMPQFRQMLLERRSELAPPQREVENR